MIGIGVVAQREIAEHRKLFPVAFALGFAPFVLVPILGLPLATTSFVGSTLALLLALGVGLILGFTMIGGELAAGRHGFFFARPLGWWQIFGGKILGGTVLALGAGLVTSLPVVVAYRQPPAASLEESLFVSAFGAFVLVSLLVVAILAAGPLKDVLLVVLSALTAVTVTVIAAAALSGLSASTAVWVGCLVLVALAAGHAAGVAWRARDAWMGLDLGLIAAAALYLRHVLATLSRAGLAPLPAQGWVSLPIVGAAATVLLVAGAAQVAHGRTDARRGHRVLSLVFWSLAWPVLAGAHFLAWWALRPALTDLVRIETVSVPPTGDWVAVAGPVRWRGSDYRGTFLVDTATDRRLRIDAQGPSPTFSADGHRVAWLEHGGGGGIGCSVVVADLTKDDVRAAVPLSPAPISCVAKELSLSPGGDQILLLEDGAARVYALDSGRELASLVSPPTGRILLGRFVGPDAVRVYRQGAASRSAESGIEILEVSLPGGAVKATGSIEAAGTQEIRLDASGDRLIAVALPPRRSARLYEGRTGVWIADLAVDDGPPISGLYRIDALDACFYDGSHVAVAVAEPSGNVRLRLFDPQGREQGAVPVGRGCAPLRLAGEFAPGLVAVGIAMAGPGDLALVDTRAARLVRRTGGLELLAGAPFPVSAPGRRLFLNEDRELVRLDEPMGAWRTLFHRSPPPLLPRSGHAMTFDDARGLVLMFGGTSHVRRESANGDTAGFPYSSSWSWMARSSWTHSLWGWDGRTWRCLEAEGPDGREQPLFAFDRKRGRAVLHGGWLGVRGRWHILNDTWEWDGSRWRFVDDSGPHGERAPRDGVLSYSAVMAYDDARGAVVLYAGEWKGGGQFEPERDWVGQAWEWDGSHWRPVSDDQARRGRVPSALVDSRLGRGPILVSAALPYGARFPSANGETALGELYSWERGPSARTWFGDEPRLTTTNSQDWRSPRVESVIAPWAAGILSYRGSETSIWNGARWAKHDGPSPPARRDTAVAYDARRGRVVLFGGEDEYGPLGDTWEWDGKQWTLSAEILGAEVTGRRRLYPETPR